MEQEYFRMEPYLRKAVQNVAKQLYPEFMRPDDDKDQKEREFWIAVYNVPMVHRHGLLVTSPSCTAASAYAHTHAHAPSHTRADPLASSSGLQDSTAANRQDRFAHRRQRDSHTYIRGPARAPLRRVRLPGLPRRGQGHPAALQIHRGAHSLHSNANVLMAQRSPPHALTTLSPTHSRLRARAASA